MLFSRTFQNLQRPNSRVFQDSKILSSSTFQDIPGHMPFFQTFQGLEFWTIKFQDFPGSVRTLLTGRYTTGPPCSVAVEAAWRHRLACAGEAACRPAVECYIPRQTTTTDADRWQTPMTFTSLAPYTMCRRASNNSCLIVSNKLINSFSRLSVTSIK